MATADVEVLLDMAEGYTAEHGPDAVRRYTRSGRISQAIINAQAAIRHAKCEVVCHDHPRGA